MKKFLAVTIILILGAGLLGYPHIAAYSHKKSQSFEVQSYEQKIDEMDKEWVAEEWEKAVQYNNSLTGEEIRDPFVPGTGMAVQENYWELLDTDGKMGFIKIPKIGVNLPIYHGTSDSVLQKGIGHLEGSALPVGDVGTHTVFTGHTGLTSAKMFTDLTELEAGDRFYLHILDRVMAYEVDQIKVVEPSDTNDLYNVKEADYATLITCTPYGINSHRLLVRGRRIPYVEEEEQQEEEAPVRTGLTQEQKVLFRTAAVTTAVMLLLVILVAVWRHNRDKTEAFEAQLKGWWDSLIG